METPNMCVYLTYTYTKCHNLFKLSININKISQSIELWMMGGSVIRYLVCVLDTTSRPSGLQLVGTLNLYLIVRFTQSLN